MSPVGAARSGAPLRVGLVLDGLQQPRWIHRVVSTLIVDPGFEAAVLLLPRPEPVSGGWLLRRYESLDRARYARPDDALAVSDLGRSLDGLPVRPLAAPGGRLDAAGLALVRGLGLDVALRLGAAETPLRAPGLARHGVLSLRHGCGDDGFTEVARGEPCTVSELRLLGTEEAHDVVLDRSFSQTDATSLHGSRERRAEKGGELLLRALRRLGQGEGSWSSLAAAAATSGPASSRRAAGPERVVPGLARLATRRLREVAEKLLYEERWIVAAMQAPTWPPDPSRFEEWLPPPGLLWADPFPFVRNGRIHVFLEECALAAPRAHLAVLEVGADGRPGPTRPVLERPYHLSYPFVFEWQGVPHLLPETAENRTVELYRCISFPDRWELDRVLLDGLRAYDATLLEHEGRWWLFACVAVEDAPPLDELHVFHAPGPRGPFEPVAGNPVVSDVRRARPAGRIFRAGEAWIRPAQDGSGRYGRAVRFQRILRLDPAGYAEREEHVLEPGWRPDVLGVHTWNACEPVGGGPLQGLAVLDAIKRRLRF